jgi:phage shock protein A
MIKGKVGFTEVMMMDDDAQRQIDQYRETAQSLGDAAREAMQRGDIGWARTAARQAAQFARVVIKLETGEKQVEPEDDSAQIPSLNV